MDQFDVRGERYMQVILGKPGTSDFYISIAYYFLKIHDLILHSTMVKYS